MRIEQSEHYKKWRKSLKDSTLRALITSRLDRISLGYLGDIKPIGEGLAELRIHYGAGYRIYVQQRGNRFIILLCGGDKSSQKRDIAKAKQIAETWKE